MEKQDLIFLVLIIVIVILIMILFYMLISNFKTRKASEDFKRFLKDELNIHSNNIHQSSLITNQSIGDIKNSLNKDILSFNNYLQEEFRQLENRTINRLNNFENNLNINLNESYKNQNETFNKINEKMVGITETQKNLDLLSHDILTLQSLLQDKKSRGIFGEIELYSLLEKAYGLDDRFWKRQYKLSNGNIADAVIMGNDNLGLLVIDSKFPLDNYRKMFDKSIDKVDREYASKAFKKDVIKHIDDIAYKYLNAEGVATVACMFIPAEAIYAEINSGYPELLDYSFGKHVYMVSPSTLMAYITTIKSIHLNQRKEHYAREMINALKNLSQEFRRFEEREGKLYQDFQKLINDFETLKITSNKIVKSFNMINNATFNENERG